MGISGMKSCRSLTVAMLITAGVVALPNHAFAACTISTARLQQVSEREILAIISGSCTREQGESGYFTEISPGVYGEVMAVYGRRNIDQYGAGWQSDYGFNIVFPESRDSYSAGVWIADADGVVHSAEITIQNAFATTTSTTTTQVVPTTSSVLPTLNASSELVVVQPGLTNASPSSASAEVIEDDGIEDDFAEVTARSVGGKWLIEIDSSHHNAAMTVKFRKSGMRTITWNVVTGQDGTRRILTSRNLTSGALALIINGVTVDRISVG